MVSRLAALALFPILGAVAFFIAYFVFYSGGVESQPSPELGIEQISVSALPPRASADLPTGQLRQGLMVVDAQHGNSFTERELVAFVSRVADRGFEVEILGDFTPIVDPSQFQARVSQLSEKLRQADSYVVILPQLGFSPAEAALVERFVNRGGKLLLVSDPSRAHNINALAMRFGVDFQPDYLYDTLDNDANYKRIFIRDFQPDQLTAGVESITLELAGSVQSPGGGLAFTGPGTKSSLLDAADTLTPMAWGNDRNVLALADFTFMVGGHESLLDNGRLLSNIADFLTDSERQFLLSDFPYFYGDSRDEGIDILLGQSGLLNIGLQLKSTLAGWQVASEISSLDDPSRDSVFIGLFEDAAKVNQYLQVAGVRVDDTLRTPFAPELELAGTALMVLDQGQDRDMLVILADSPATLNGAVGRLLSGQFRVDLVSDTVAVRKFEVMGN